MKKDTTRLVIGSLNVCRGLLNFQKAIFDILPKYDLFALQEADAAVVLPILTYHTHFPPLEDTGNPTGEWLFVSKASGWTVLHQTTIKSKSNTCYGQKYVLASPGIPGNMLLLNLHLPTCIDDMNDDAEPLKEILDTLKETLRDVSQFTHCVAAGDFNETDSLALDRSSPTTGGRGRVAALLKSLLFTDAYRALHPSGGHTHTHYATKSTSRLDKIWVRGESLYITGAEVCCPPKKVKTDHSILSTTINVPSRNIVKCATLNTHHIPLAIFSDNKQMKTEFAERVEKFLSSKYKDINDGLLAKKPQQRDDAWQIICTCLTSIAMDVAKLYKPKKKDCSSQLNKTLNDAILLFSGMQGTDQFLSDVGHHEYSAEQRTIIGRLPNYLKPPIHFVVGSARWNDWINELILKRSETAPQKKYPEIKTERDLFSRLRGSAAKQVDSVIDLDGNVTFDPVRVKTITRNNFVELIGVSAVTGNMQHEIIKSTLNEGRKLQEQDLFSDVLDTQSVTLEYEIVDTLKKCSDVIGVGSDNVPDSLFKWAVLNRTDSVLLQLLIVMVQQNFRGIFLKSAKEGSMKCIPKPNQAMGSFGRGITKGNLPGKLPSAILSRRMDRIITEHNLLNENTTHAYLSGREAHDAIRKWLQAWRHAKDEKLPCFNVFYDLAKAFDKISWRMILDGLISIGASLALLTYIKKYLKNNRIRVETTYGYTEWIDMLRGIKQGDPLSAMLFIIAMNLFHKSLELAGDDAKYGLSPFVLHGERHSTDGYSDDLRTIQCSESGILACNALIMSICQHYGIEMNAKKIIAVGRTWDGVSSEEWKGMIPIETLVNGSLLTTNVKAHPPTNFIKHLGIEYNMDMRTLVPHRIESRIDFFGHLITQNHIPTHWAAKAYNAIVVSWIDYKCRYLKWEKDKLDRWDSMILSALCRTMPCNGDPSYASIKTTYNIKVPSEVVMVSRTVTLHKILISDGTEGSTARAECYSKKKPFFGSEFKIAAIGHVFFDGNDHYNSFRSIEKLTPNKTITISRGAVKMNTNKLKLWGASCPANKVKVWTDGSFKVDEDTSEVSAAWAVVLGTDVFYEKWKQLAPCKNDLERHDVVSSVTSVSGKIPIPGKPTRGGRDWDGTFIDVTASFHPEAIALLYALVLFPVTWEIEVVSDSESVIEALMGEMPSVRKHVRKCFHQVIYLIRIAIQIRKSYAANTILTHQRSHTGGNTENAIGNEMADIICNARRIGQGLGVSMLNTDCGDQRVTVTLRRTRVISDLRRAMWTVLQTDHLTNWMSSSHWPMDRIDKPEVKHGRFSRMQQFFPERIDPHVARPIKSVTKLLHNHKYLLPILTGILGNTGLHGGPPPQCGGCPGDMAGQHITQCIMYKQLHMKEVSRLARLYTGMLTFSPSKRPQTSTWLERLYHAVLAQKVGGHRAIQSDGRSRGGGNLWLWLEDGTWVGYMTPQALKDLVRRRASPSFLVPPCKKQVMGSLAKFAQSFVKDLALLLHHYECRRRCQGPAGDICTPHFTRCNTRAHWRPGHNVIDVATDILGATVDVSANAIDLDWKFEHCESLHPVDALFGSFPRGPAPTGTVFFSFLSRRDGKPPACGEIDKLVNRAKFEVNARMIMFMAVNSVLLAHLKTVVNLVTIAFFPPGTISLRPPAVWRHQPRKCQVSSFPFILCIWQGRPYSEAYTIRRYFESKFLELGLRRISRQAHFYQQSYKLLWSGNVHPFPFSDPGTRAQLLYLLSPHDEQQLVQLGLSGKNLKDFICFMQKNIFSFILKSWLPLCPKLITRARRRNTKKASKPKNLLQMGDPGE